MAISDTQKVDYLWKKIAYGTTKTDLGTAKQGFEESIASPLLIRGDRIWQQSGSIPASIATSSSVVTVYSGSTTVECTEDATAADNRTWKTNLTDWISPEFGADYLVSVYIANSGITGSNKTTQVTISANKITAAGVNDDQWYFDYQSGVLHFIGTNIPTAITTGITGKSIYITGARYTGGLGFETSSSTTSTTGTLGNLYIATNTISSIDTNANINLSPNGTGNVVISSNVSAGNLVTANYFSGNGSLLTGVTATTATTATTAFKLANGTSNVNIATIDGNITMAVGGTANVAIITTTGVNIAGYVNLGSGNLITTGNASASYFLGNGSQLTGIVSSYGNANVAIYLPTYTGDISGGNLTLTGNLLVSGTLTTVNSTTTRVVDPIIEQGGGANGAALSSNDGKDRGTLLHYYSGSSAVDAFMGWDNSNAEFAFGSNVTVASEVVTFYTFGNIRAGNAVFSNTITANYFIGSGANLTSIAGANVTGQVGNALLSGTVYTNAQPNITSVGVLTSLSVTGNISSGNANLGNLVTANFFSGNGSLLTGITGSYSNTNVSAYLSTYTGNLSASNVSFTGANVSLGSVSNLHIDGGTSGYFLTTDGSGGLSWAAQTALTATVDEFTANGTYTTFTLSTTPSSENVTMVAVQGVLQPKSSYSLMGPQLTFDAPPPASAFIEVTTFSGGSGGAGGGGSSSSALTWNIASSNATMVANNGYFVDTSSSAKTMTLPTSATLGDTIRINDLAGTFNTNNLTVARNGHKIQGVAQDLLVDVDQSSFGLVYSNSTYGWKVLEL